LADDPRKKPEYDTRGDTNDWSDDHHHDPRWYWSGAHRSGLFGVIRDVGVKEQHVRASHPHAVHNADEQTVQKMAGRYLSRNDDRANDENDQPEDRFDVRRNDENRGDGHRQTEERQAEDQFPVHGAEFLTYQMVCKQQ